jgi:hypothetical protein
MKKSVVLLLVLAIVAAGNVFAQDIRLDKVKFSADVSQLSLNSGVTVTPLQAGGGERKGSPVGAAFLNVLGGWYSWSVGDIFGGALTAGLEAVGLILPVAGVFTIASAVDAEDGEALSTGILMVAGGGAAFAGGAIFGFFRGWSQYKKVNGIAWTGNPFDHVSFGIAPDGGGILAFSARF